MSASTTKDQGIRAALFDAPEAVRELIELGNLMHFAIMGLREHCRGLEPSADDFDALERGSILLRAKGRELEAMISAAEACGEKPARAPALSD